jgi:hypothetical protein
MRAASSPGDSPEGSAPMAARRSRTSGIWSTLATSVWILAITSRGVPAGTISAYHDTASKPGKSAADAMVGTPGNASRGAVLATPSARSVPALMCGRAEGTWAIISWMRPPNRSFIAGPTPW